VSVIDCENGMNKLKAAKAMVSMCHRLMLARADEVIGVEAELSTHTPARPTAVGLTDEHLGPRPGADRAERSVSGTVRDGLPGAQSVYAFGGQKVRPATTVRDLPRKTAD
jgi:hypothetical protein